MARLRVKSGSRVGELFEVVDEVVIGRGGADVLLEDEQVSGRHVVVRRMAGGLEVEDLGSSNGTFIDGDRIEGPTRVEGGAQIRLGTTVLEVEGVIPGHQGNEPDREATQLKRVPTEMTRPQPAQPASAAPAQRAEPVPAAPGTPTVPVGEFHPPSRHRRRGLDSRSWVPLVLSFGTVMLTAIGLVIYFAAR